MVLLFTRQDERGREVNEFVELWCLNPINLTKLNCLLLAVLRQSFLFHSQHHVMMRKMRMESKKVSSIINISSVVSVELIKFEHFETRWLNDDAHRRFVKNHLQIAVQDESLTRLTESSQIICGNWNDSARKTGYANEAEKLKKYSEYC